MPYTLIELPESHHTLSRPIARQVVREVADRVGIRPDTQIFFPGPLGSISTPGSTIGEQQEIVTGDDGMAGITIELTEEYNEDSLFTTAMHQSEHPPIFHDASLGITMRPVYSQTVSSLAFSVRFKSKTEAQKWQNHIRHKSSAGQRELLHNFNYAYLFPVELLQLVRHCYDLRETNAGYGDEWSKYATDHFTPRLKLLSNQAGDYQSPAIAEKQTDVIGWWDFELAPEVDTISQAGEHWIVSFEYQYTYDKPSAVAAHYPVIVHQNLLERKWLPQVSQEDVVESAPSYTSKTRYALDLLNKTTKHIKMQSGVQLPVWDDWRPKAVPSDTATIFTALLMISSDDPTKLLDLNDLGRYEFDKEFLKYIGTYPGEMTQRGASPIQVEIYENDSIVSRSDVYVDGDLMVRVEGTLDPRKIFHVRLSIMTNLKLLGRRAIKRLLENPKACMMVLKTLDDSLEERGLLPQILGGSYVHPKQFDQAVDHINRGLLTRKAVLEPYVGTVGYFFVRSAAA